MGPAVNRPDAEHLTPVPGTGTGLSVTGGYGGIRFQWEELERAAAVLGRLSETVGGVHAALLFASAELERVRLESVWHPGGADAGTAGAAAAEALRTACRGTSDAAGELEDTAQRISASRFAYLAAEMAATLAIAAASRSAEHAARAAASAAVREGVLEPRPLSLTPLTGGAGAEVPFSGTVEALVTRLEAVEAEAPGSFEILHTDGDAGPSYVVVLPGTQGTGSGRNPFDTAGIAEAVDQDSRFVGAAVAEALADAGAVPGDGVVIAGYSQGGLHAMNLAVSEAVGGVYDVRLVVTAGSPTGWERPGAGEYLHLEHEGDAVPALDAAPNPDELHRVTVTLGNPVPALPEGGQAKGFGAHGLKNYARGAPLVDASTLPSLAPAAAVLAGAAGGGPARRHLYQAVRRPVEPAGANVPERTQKGLDPADRTQAARR